MPGILLYVHLLAAVIWIGGMFFAYIAVRPAAAQLPPDLQFPFWVRVFGRFFPWVWVSFPALLVTGSAMASQGRPGPAVWLMAAAGIAMMSIFLHVYFAPYRRLRRAAAAADWSLAGKQLRQIRRLAGISTVLGFLVLALGIFSFAG